jgi:hypothetical protein
MKRQCRPVGVFVVLLVAAILVMPAVALGKSASGQAWSAKRLSKAVRVTKKAKSKMTFTIRKDSASKVTAYAAPTTKYYERGPNDSDYHCVGQP